MKMQTARATIAGIIFVLIAPLAHAASYFSGTVTRIIDGDTVEVLVTKGETKTPVRVRLVDIDAPEKGQPYGEKSRQTLAKLIYDVDVTVIDKGSDRYGRTLGLIMAPDRTIPAGARPIGATMDVNYVMVVAGMAWAYRYHGKASSQDYADAEEHSRSKGVGLWADKNPVEPWKWRRNAKAAGTD